MKCPKCGRTKDQVVYREARGGMVVRIRRCAWCKALNETRESRRCPNCGCIDTRILGGTKDMKVVFSRYRICNDCATRFRTYEETTNAEHRKAR